MNVLIITSIVMILVLLVGLGLMALFVGASRAVVTNAAEIDLIDKQSKAVDPRKTKGFPINTALSVDEQVLEARKLAAQAAAATPRGANMGIGRADTVPAPQRKKHVVKGLDSDPLSAVKIAQFHTWNGLTYQAPTQAPQARVAAGPTKMVPRKLVAGKDYEVVPVTADMSGPDRRRAIIANAKAKAAAYKALKESGQLMVAQAATTAAPAAAAVAAAPAVAVPEPDYIEITDAMSPDEQRQAKIKNAKLKSAYQKALKEAGIDPSSAPASLPEAAPVAQAAAPQPAPAAAPAANMPPPPDLVTITDDMPPDEMRQAKIANAKALSAYKKELKAAGIDPSTVDL